MAMSDGCHFNFLEACSFNHEYPNLPPCNFISKLGMCTATEDDLITEEEWLEMKDNDSDD